MLDQSAIGPVTHRARVTTLLFSKVANSVVALLLRKKNNGGRTPKAFPKGKRPKIMNVLVVVPRYVVGVTAFFPELGAGFGRATPFFDLQNRPACRKSVKHATFATQLCLTSL